MANLHILYMLDSSSLQNYCITEARMHRSHGNASQFRIGWFISGFGTETRQDICFWNKNLTIMVV